MPEFWARSGAWTCVNVGNDVRINIQLHFVLFRDKIPFRVRIRERNEQPLKSVGNEFWVHRSWRKTHGFEGQQLFFVCQISETKPNYFDILKSWNLWRASWVWETRTMTRFDQHLRNFFKNLINSFSHFSVARTSIEKKPSKWENDIRSSKRGRKQWVTQTHLCFKRAAPSHWTMKFDRSSFHKLDNQ